VLNLQLNALFLLLKESLIDCPICVSRACYSSTVSLISFVQILIVSLFSPFLESTGLCGPAYTLQSTPIFSIDFGSGSSQYSTATPSAFNFTTTYTQQFAPLTIDGQFSFINSVPDDFNGAWFTGALDHTPNDVGGYMYLVNADVDPDQFYNGTVNNLVVGQKYQFSVFVANLLTTVGIQPNIIFQVRSPAPNNVLLAQIATGNISATPTITWVQYGISFTAVSESVTLLMISNAPGGYGNDLVIDDIVFQVCNPIPTTTTPAPTTAAPPPTTAAPAPATPAPANSVPIREYFKEL
jgi:hypothetical protein